MVSKFIGEPKLVEVHTVRKAITGYSEILILTDKGGEMANGVQSE